MAGLIPFNRKRSNLRSVGFNDFYDLVDDFFSEDWPLRRSLAKDTFKLDVKDDDKNYYVSAEVPGVEKDDINLSIDDGRLNISIERDEQTEDKEKNYLHKERRYCSMQRNIFLADADDKDIKAKLENGLLNITIPKVAGKKKSRNIEID